MSHQHADFLYLYRWFSDILASLKIEKKTALLQKVFSGNIPQPTKTKPHLTVIGDVKESRKVSLVHFHATYFLTKSMQ